VEQRYFEKYLGFLGVFLSIQWKSIVTKTVWLLAFFKIIIFYSTEEKKSYRFGMT